MTRANHETAYNATDLVDCHCVVQGWQSAPGMLWDIRQELFGQEPHSRSGQLPADVARQVKYTQSSESEREPRSACARRRAWPSPGPADLAGHAAGRAGLLLPALRRKVLRRINRTIEGSFQMATSSVPVTPLAYVSLGNGPMLIFAAGPHHDRRCRVSTSGDCSWPSVDFATLPFYFPISTEDVWAIAGANSTTVIVTV